MKQVDIGSQKELSTLVFPLGDRGALPKSHQERLGRLSHLQSFDHILVKYDAYIRGLGSR